MKFVSLGDRRTSRVNIPISRVLLSLLLSAAAMWAMVPQKKGSLKRSGNRVVAASLAKKTRPVALLAVPRVPIAASRLQTSRAPRAKSVRAIIPSGPWRVPTFADSTQGDRLEGDDLLVRRAAVDALGKMNGSIVVAEAETGRVLSVVNQKLAFRDGFQPCSTVKIPVALAGLSESVVDRTTPVRLNRWTKVDLTTALAKSNNLYFANVGEKLGFERMSTYARMFGLGEKAGLDIEDEQAGILPAAEPKSGMGMMTSFGDGISLTPLELTALVGAVANGGTLYYLQYPKTQDEADILIPHVKRHLEIDPFIPEIMPGLKGAVDFGTARRIGADASEQIFGKTGTCTDERSPTHLGWFGSFIHTTSATGKKGNLVVVVLLTGGRGVSGPAAAGVAGAVYRNLETGGFFQSRNVATEALLIPGFPKPRASRFTAR